MKRKTFLSLALLAALTSPGLLAAPKVYTAEWLNLHAPEMEGRSHTVNIACVEFLRRENDVVWFRALTSDGETGTGWVDIGVRADRADIIQARYGAWSDFKKARGYPQRGFTGIVRYSSQSQTVALIESDLAQPAPAPTPEKPASPTSRTWTSADGRTVEATLIHATDTEITIVRTSDNAQFRLAIDKLSQADQDYVATWRKSRKRH